MPTSKRFTRPLITFGPSASTTQIADNFGYANYAAFLAAGWSENIAAGSGCAFSLAADATYGGAVVRGTCTAASVSGGTFAFVQRTFGGFTAGQQVRVTVRAKGTHSDLGYSDLVLAATGASGYDETESYTRVDNTWVTLSRVATADGSGNVLVQMGFNEVTSWGNISVDFGALTVSSGTGLYVARFDAATAWPAPMPGSAWPLATTGGARDGWLINGMGEYRLKGTARQIPRVDQAANWEGNKASGWDAWQTFFSWARDRQPFTFFPDQTDLATSYPCVLEEPMAGRPDAWDGISYRKVDLTLRVTWPASGALTPPARVEGY